MPELSRERLLAAFESMLLIRRTEEQLIHLREDEKLLQGHYHVYIGQEATAAGVCAALEASDFVFTTHRNHGHILARGGKPEPLIAEILGRASGYNGGRSGTLHPVAPALGIIHTSAIVGGALTIAAGAAFSAKRRNSGQVAVVFFGDGALEEGASYEAANMAALWKLPLVMICENNSIPPELRKAGQYPSSTHAARQLVDVAAALSIPAATVDGADLQAVHDAAVEAVTQARRGEGARFIEARTSRWPGNFPLYPTPIGPDTDVGWAWDASSASLEQKQWLERSDPLLLLARQLVAGGKAERDELLDIDRRVTAAVVSAAKAAKAAPLPDPASALQGVFA